MQGRSTPQKSDACRGTRTPWIACGWTACRVRPPNRGHIEAEGLPESNEPAVNIPGAGEHSSIHAESLNGLRWHTAKGESRRRHRFHPVHTLAMALHAAMTRGIGPQKPDR